MVTFPVVSSPRGELQDKKKIHELTACHYSMFYDKLHYTRNLIGSYLLSIGGQTHGGRHRLERFASLSYEIKISHFVVCLYSNRSQRSQNVVGTSVIHSATPREPLFCSYHILTSSITEQTYGKRESIC